MRVLFLTHRLPYAPNRGDRLRAFHILKALRGRAKVHLISLVHDLTGYRTANAYALNAVLYPITLALAYYLGRRLQGALGATSTILRRPFTCARCRDWETMSVVPCPCRPANR